ncbi:hypothetical protein Tco_1117379, partial [Tanacetum coccineum]
DVILNLLRGGSKAGGGDGDSGDGDSGDDDGADDGNDDDDGGGGDNDMHHLRDDATVYLAMTALIASGSMYDARTIFLSVYIRNGALGCNQNGWNDGTRPGWMMEVDTTCGGWVGGEGAT